MPRQIYGYFWMAIEFSENILILMAVHGIIHFTLWLITFLSLKCQKGLNIYIFSLKTAILDFKMAMELSRNILI